MILVAIWIVSVMRSYFHRRRIAFRCGGSSPTLQSSLYLLRLYEIGAWKVRCIVHTMANQQVQEAKKLLLEIQSFTKRHEHF